MVPGSLPVGGRSPFTLVHALLGLTVLAGGVVMVEPAPYDLLMVGTVAVGPLLLWPSMRSSLALPFLLAALLMLSNGISLLLMVDLHHGVGFFGVTAYLLLSWGLIVAWLDRLGSSLLTTLTRAHALGAGLTGALAVGAYFSVLPGHDLMCPDGRLQGLFKDANVFGAFMVFPVLLAIARFDEARGRSLVLMGVGVLALLLSYSRGAWINLFIGVFTYAGLRGLAGRVRPSLGHIAAIFGVLVLLGGLLVLAFEHPAVREMLEIRATSQNYDHDRFANQADVLAVALKYPMGVGPGATETRFTISAHSLYLRAFMENGMLGLWATLGLVLTSLGRSVWAAIASADDRDARVLAVVAGALAGTMVESAIIDSIHWRHFWLLLALAWAPRVASEAASRDHRYA